MCGHCLAPITIINNQSVCQTSGLSLLEFIIASYIRESATEFPLYSWQFIEVFRFLQEENVLYLRLNKLYINWTEVKKVSGLAVRTRGSLD